MANQELLDYIMRQRAHGANAINIKDALLKAGWDQRDVEAGIAATEPAALQPVATPPPVFASNTMPAASPVVPEERPAASTAQSAAPVTSPISNVHMEAPAVAQPLVPASTMMPPITAAHEYMNTPTIKPLSSASSFPTVDAPLISPGMHVPATPVENPLASSSGTPMATAALPGAGMIAPGTQILPPIDALPRVQIPSANFMPKTEPLVAPPLAPVTNVMPSAEPLVAKKSSLGMIISIVLIVIVLLGGGGFAYWKYFPTVPPPVIPADRPIVQDVNVPPDVVPADTTTAPLDTGATGAGPIGFPSSLQTATTTESAPASTTDATTTAEATSSPEASTTQP